VAAVAAIVAGAPTDAAWQPMLLAVLGAVLVAGTMAKSLLRRFDVPALVGYLLLGLVLGTVDRGVLHLPDEAHRALRLLGDLGVVCLLFRVGLESDLRILQRELPRASLVLVASMATSFAVGYGAAALLGFGRVPSLFVGVALSATSIAVAASVWQNAGLLRTRVGSLVVEVAELDDLATVLLMVVLFAALPALTGAQEGVAALLLALADMMLRIVAFGGACWVFARFGERRLTASFRRLRHAPEPMLVVVGITIVVAAFAAWLGFSLAVGAAFAGLVFSRDPRAVHVDAAFTPVHDLLAPFFFVVIGMELDVAVLGDSVCVGAVLLLAAVLGKLGGSMLGAWGALDLRTAAIVGVSMVPRAEIALFVIDQGRTRAPDLVPASLHGGVVWVVGGTCLLTPPLLRRLLATGRPRIVADGPMPEP